MAVADVIPQLRAALAGRYAVERELGSGGWATVYLAHDHKHDRKVAVKVLRSDVARTLGAARFLREISIAGRLIHPHILPLYDSGEAGDSLYYVMPFIEGETLRQRLLREHQLPLADTLTIARQVADALTFAHAHNVVHRDIKPENILLEGDQAYVADFGIARAMQVAGGDTLSSPGFAIGTPAYMSPEQAAGTPVLDGRSDLYSLACVVYEMLAGEPPHGGPTAQAILARQQMETPRSIRVLRPTLPEGVERAILTALAKPPADRFPTVSQFTTALATSAETRRRGDRGPWPRVRSVDEQPAPALGTVIPAVPMAVKNRACADGLETNPSHLSGPRLVPPAVNDPDLAGVEPVSTTTKHGMAPDPEREPDRDLAGKQLEPEAKIDPGSNVSRFVLLIHDQHAPLTLLIEVGVPVYVQPRADLPIDASARASCPPADERRDSPAHAGVLELAGPARYIGREVLAQDQVLVETRFDTEREGAARMPTFKSPCD